MFQGKSRTTAAVGNQEDRYLQPCQPSRASRLKTNRRSPRYSRPSAGTTSTFPRLQSTARTSGRAARAQIPPVRPEHESAACPKCTAIPSVPARLPSRGRCMAAAIFLDSASTQNTSTQAHVHTRTCPHTDALTYGRGIGSPLACLAMNYAPAVFRDSLERLARADPCNEPPHRRQSPARHLAANLKLLWLHEGASAAFCPHLSPGRIL
mmetsp:Transcript_1588/g.4274  ORF Transcript_1588/g.4274 Transcript_1588/m.4274 type:complete len:209 (+) Transcript_1588:126-752(+)